MALKRAFVVLAVAAAVGAGIGADVAWGEGSPARGHAPRPPASAPAASRSAGAARSTAPSASASAAGPRPGFAARVPADPVPAAPSSLPVQVSIPRVGVHSALVQLGIAPDGSLQVPGRDSFDEAGWLTTSAPPGEDGAAVIAGHVDSTSGPAVFFHLREVRPGDEVDVVRADASTVRFTVDSLQEVDKDHFPTDAVYGPQPGPVLRLITCGGSFDRASGHYRDNVIVYASAAQPG